MQKIVIIEAVGSPHLVDVEDGQRLYQTIHDYVEKREQIELSFSGVEQIITAFANAAIGQLYNDFTESTVRRYITLSDMDDITRDVLSMTVTRAKEFFKNPDRIRDI